MTIRNATLTIITVTTLLFVGLTLFASSHIIGDSFLQLEIDGARDDAVRARRGLQRLVDTTDALVWDWASWDDTVQFVQDANAAYIESNLHASTMSDQKLNVLLVADPSGRIVWGSGYDLEAEALVPLPPSLAPMLCSGGELHNLSSPSKPVAGVLPLSEGLLLVSSRPILTSSGEGPAKGMVVMGRFLTETMLDQLRESLQLSVVLYPSFAMQERMRTTAWDPWGLAVEVMDEVALRSLARVEGVGGQGVLVLEVVSGRPMYVLMRHTIRNVAVALLLMGSLFCIVTVLLLEGKVLCRIRALGAQMAAIGRQRDPARRVSLAGRDELAVLAGNINGMLDEINTARTEAALRQSDLEESDAFMARLFDSIQAGVLLIDAQDRSIVYANAFALNLVGTDLASFRGQICHKAFCTSSNGICPVLDKGQDVALNECDMSRADKSMLHILKSVTKVERKGRPYLLETFTDISPIHEAKEKLQAAKASLEDEVAVRTRELREANTRLTELNQLKSSFLSSASHELRTPLTSVMGFLKLSDKKFTRWFEPLAKGDPELESRAREFKANFAIMELEAERLRRLINDLLDLNRIESGRMSWDNADVDLSALLEKVAQSFQPHFEGRPDVAFETSIAPDLPHLTVDPDRLTQVVVNLVHNADKFTLKGSIRLEAGIDGDGFVLVRVRDTGCGIPAGDVERIFESFYQSQARGGANSNKNAGTGLGLAICSQIVQHYGGVIWVESEEGKGSVFSFRLPRA
ncbi:MAG: CHASE4 domain-containing protein [Desulfovibrionaceae bacterium]